MNILSLEKYKSILCLNGELPEREFFNKNLPVIAADGAANTLIKMNIVPQIVIGDLDSITEENLKLVKTHFHYDQNYCDFEKSLFYLTENELLPAIIVGINGGFLDHVLNNINLFVKTQSILYAPPVYGFTMHRQETRSFVLPIHTKISLLGLPNAKVSTKGLKWNLDENDLSFPGRNSCFNRTCEENIEIEIHEGVLLLLVYKKDGVTS